MYLKSIKLAGFKSFVDPTTIRFSSNLLGIVGPNGCGKSNIVDAVKWVMGESSAKTLRGESMADVIFSGANTRKPAGMASVELVFDNREGKLGGKYASFDEISVKRAVSRNGQSQYSFNGTRCRRRDITDVFLGTGLGAHSYAIIEQGMVSSLIEARPEELRIYLEEAAGISRYKERRRETENRIRHTRENLERLTDLREELEKQLNHLKRQSEAAEQYKALKQEERQIKSELVALRWKTLDSEAEKRQQKIKEKENLLEKSVSRQRELEAGIEKQRAASIETSDEMNTVQGRYHRHGSEIARLEAAIKHAQETRQQQQEEMQRLQQQLQEVEAHLAQDQESIAGIHAELEQKEPQLADIAQQQASCLSVLQAAEEAMQVWQQDWERLGDAVSGASQSVQVEATRIEHIQRHIKQLTKRQQALEEEKRGLITHSDDPGLREARSLGEQLHVTESGLQVGLETVQKDMAHQRAENTQQAQQVDEVRELLQQSRAELATLHAVQNAAFGGTNEQVTQWLDSSGLAKAPRLAQKINVEAGWELAVEVVLGHFLEAVCVDDETEFARHLVDLESGRICLINNQPQTALDNDTCFLLSKVTCRAGLVGLLRGVYIADDLDSALLMRSTLPEEAIIVTRGGVCVGQQWVRVTVEQGKEGLLQREQHIKTLGIEIDRQASELNRLSAQFDAGREAYQKLESRRDELQQQIHEIHRQVSEVRADINSREATLHQVNERINKLESAVEQVTQEIAQEDIALESAREKLDNSRVGLEQFKADKARAGEQRESLSQALQDAREQANDSNDEKNRITMQIESLRSRFSAMQQHQERMLDQQHHLLERRKQLEEALSEEISPLQEMGGQRDTLLEERQRFEDELTKVRAQVEAINHELHSLEQRRHAAGCEVEDARSMVEKARMAWQEIDVRCQGLIEQLEETGHNIADILNGLSPEAGEDDWARALEKIERRISQLGPINLAAIDEYKVQSERKAYLDKQNDDLTEALETLGGAIRKIDRETRTRFKDTYDQVNAGMQKMFPRLFGGGHGYLNLTGEDLLEAGVSVMARPPGKRNSSIHLLSGGEKAMTAVSLLFSLFQLNPAPFCMLDEIDAPLDDANVGRFCEVVTEMSAHIQFIVVTHSKITMERVSRLTGVTMQEAGVSRLVTVDIDEAVEMVAV